MSPDARQFFRDADSYLNMSEKFASVKANQH